MEKANMNGVADLFAGAKFQIVGPKAPVQNDNMRFAVATGVIIPMPGADFEKEFENMMKGEEARVQNMDNHVFGLGARFAFDYQINENFFINLYNETILFPVKGDLSKADMGSAMVLAGFNDNLAAVGASASGEINYKFALTFEIEPVFSTFIADGIQLNAGLPINYKFTPAAERSVTVTGHPLGTAGNTTTEEAIMDMLGPDGEDSQILSINPGVSIFMMKLPLPLEFKFQYNLPVWGKNAMSTHSAIFQVRAYFAF
jgi:hypothetical protein